MKLAEEFDNLIQKYEIRFKSEDISLNTLRAAKNSLGKLKLHWGHHSHEKITTEMWQKFQQKYDEKFPGETQFNMQKFFVVFIKHLAKKGVITKIPEIQNMFAKREEANRKKKKNWVLSPDDIKALYKACENDKERLAVGLGERLAFRISDCVRLSWDRVVVGQGDDVSFIRFSGEDKAKKTVDIPVPENLMELLLKIPKTSKWVYPQSRNPDQHLITQQLDFNKIRDRAGLKRGGWHDLRRYRLSADFNNAEIPHALTIELRRIEFNTAKKHYIVTTKKDLKLMLEKSK